MCILSSYDTCVRQLLTLICHYKSSIIILKNNVGVFNVFNPENLANNIKKCRTKLGLTQQELAEKMYVSSQAISKWESGQSVPDLANLTLLSDIFFTSVDKIIDHKLSYGGKVFLGIDGGSAKTEFALIYEDGRVINKLVLDGCNPKIFGLDKTLSVLKRGIDKMLSVTPDIHGGFAGIHGVMYGEIISEIKSFISGNYPLLKLYIDKDACNVVASVPQFEESAAMICDTGFAIHVKVDGEYHKVGSWGYLLDDMCGSYGIGREVIRAALAHQDGFGKETLMTQRVCEKLGCSVLEDTIGRIYSEDGSFIASFAPIAFEAGEKGDEVAMDILKLATDHMTDMLKYALSTYRCDRNVVLAGSLARYDILAKLLSDKMGGRVNFVILELPPIYGACVKACQRYGKMSEGFYDNFKKSYFI